MIWILVITLSHVKTYDFSPLFFGGCIKTTNSDFFFFWWTKIYGHSKLSFTGLLIKDLMLWWFFERCGEGNLGSIQFISCKDGKISVLLWNRDCYILDVYELTSLWPLTLNVWTNFPTLMLIVWSSFSPLSSKFKPKLSKHKHPRTF